MSVRARQDLRLSAGARGLGLLALVIPVLWSQEGAALLGLLAVAVVGCLAQLAQSRRPAGPLVLVAAEALAVGVVCGRVLPTSVALLGALAVPAFTAGLRVGGRGVVVAVGTQTAALLAVLAAYDEITADGVFSAVTWGIASLGIGLIAGSVNSSLQDFSDPLATYRYAQKLLRELIDLSGGLSSGLDPVALGSTILRTVRDGLPTAALVLYVQRGDALTPLLTDPTPDAGTGVLDELAVEAWSRNRPVFAGDAFALPAGHRGRHVGGRRGRLSERVEAQQIGLDERVDELGARLAAPTPSTSTPPCCSPRSATPRPPTSAAASPVRCTTASPRTSPRSATWSTRSPPGRPGPTGRAGSPSCASGSPPSSGRSAARC